MSVAALVLEYGGNRDEAIAGLLHDSIESSPISGLSRTVAMMGELASSEDGRPPNPGGLA